MTFRNFNDPEYKKFRYRVKARDKYTCRWPNCGSKIKLHVHHIIPWSDSVPLRFEITNGITLCKRHHDLVKGNEYNYIKVFRDILNG